MAMRTIYIAIRGVNYTDRATREVGRNIDVLVKAQQELRQQAVVMLSAGIMWGAFAGLAIMSIGKIITASGEGRRAMRSFERATNELMKGLSVAFLQVLGPAIKMLTSFMQVVAKNEALLKLITVLGTLGITMIVVKSASMILGAAINYVAMQALTLQASGHLLAAGAMTQLYVGFIKLQAAMGPILLGFMLGAQLAALFGRNTNAIIAVIGALTVAILALSAALWKAGMGMSILTFGGAAIAGMGAMAVASAQTPSYQVGTEFVRRTTPAIVHEGEKITSVRDRSLGRGAEETMNRPYPVRKTEINFNGLTVQTKANKEELKPLILKTVRDAMDNRV